MCIRDRCLDSNEDRGATARATTKARNLKFGTQNDYKEFYQKNAKLGDRGGVA